MKCGALALAASLCLAAQLGTPPSRADTGLPLRAVFTPSAFDAGPFELGAGVAEALFEQTPLVELDLPSEASRKVALALDLGGPRVLGVDALQGFELRIGPSDPDECQTLAGCALPCDSLTRARFDVERLGTVALWGLSAELLIPGNILHPVGASADDPTPVRVLNAACEARALEVDSSGAFHQSDLSLPPAEITGTGVIISASRVSVDLDPEWDARADYPDPSWQGLVLGDVTVQLPESLGGVTVSATDLRIGPDGVSGSVALGGLALDFGGVGVDITEARLDIAGGAVSFGALEGVFKLDTDAFGCAVDANDGLPVQAVNGALTMGLPLSAGCDPVSLGLPGLAVTLGGAQFEVPQCPPSQVVEQVHTADYIELSLDPLAGELTLTGRESGPGSCPTHLGVVSTPMDPEPAGGPGLLLPSSMTLGLSGHACVGCSDQGASAIPAGCQDRSAARLPPHRLPVGADGDPLLCADAVVLDFDPDLVPSAWSTWGPPLQVAPDDASWQGIYFGEVSVSGVKGQAFEGFGFDPAQEIAVDARRFALGEGVVSGEVRATAELQATVAGVALSLSELCLGVSVSASSADVSLCGIEGSAALPGAFACKDAAKSNPQATLELEGDTIVARVETSALCDASFGSGDAFWVELGATDLSVSGCGASEAVSTASELELRVDPQAQEFTLRGLAPCQSADCDEPAPIGALVFAPGTLTAGQGAVVLPAEIAGGPSGICVGCGAHPMQVSRLSLGTTDLTVCASDLTIDLDTQRTAWGAQTPTHPRGEPLEPTWMGLYARTLAIESPGQPQLIAHDLAVGSDGFRTTLAREAPAEVTVDALQGVGVRLFGESGGAIDASLTSQSGQWELALAGVAGSSLGALLLPAALGGAAVEVDAVSANTSGDFRACGLTLEATEIAGSGVVVEVRPPGISVDAHSSRDCPGADSGGQQGVLLRNVSAEAPEGFAGLEVPVRAETDEEGLWIRGDGLHGEARVETGGNGLEMSLGNLGASLDSLSLCFDGASVSLCGIEGAVSLPAEYFGCVGSDRVLEVPLAYGDGVYQASVEIEAAIPAECRSITLGGPDGFSAELGGTVEKLGCDGASLGQSQRAEWLHLRVTEDPFLVELFASADAEGQLPRPIGVGWLPEPLEGPRGEPAAIVLPVALGFGAAGTCVGCDDEGMHFNPLTVGGTGVQVCASDVALDLSGTDTPDGPSHGLIPGVAPVVKGPSWRGLVLGSTRLRLPRLDAEIDGQGLYIGSDGISGQIATATPLGPFPFSGFDLRLDEIAIALAGSVPSHFAIDATFVQVPFIEQDLGVSASVDGGGDWRFGLRPSAIGDTFEVQTGGDEFTLAFKLRELSFGQKDGDLFVEIDARTRFRSGRFSPGEFEVSDLRIFGDGRVSLGGLGGWFDLPEPQGSKYAGFDYELRGVGFGRRDGRWWLGFRGHFAMADLLPVDARIDDIIFSWGSGKPSLRPGSIALSGTFPGLLTLDGGLTFCDGDTCPALAQTDCGASGAKYWKGNVGVQWHAPPMSVAGEVIVGKREFDDRPDFTFYYFSADLGLPAGIPIPPSGLSIYGFSGGFGRNVQLNVKDGFPRGIDRENPVIPACDEGALVFNAGVTLGMSGEDFIFNCDVALNVGTAGPVIALTGDAWLLTTLEGRNPATAVGHADVLWDGFEDDFIVSANAKLQLDPQKGVGLKAGGAMEMLFGEPEWHIYLGTREHPIGGHIAGVIDSSVFLMLGNKIPVGEGEFREGFVAGAESGFGGSIAAPDGWVGVDWRLYYGGEFGWQWLPHQFQVAFEAGGHARAWLGPFVAGFEAQARLEGEVYQPARLGASFKVKLRTPWPFPNPSWRVGYSLSLNDKKHDSFPQPLQEVAAQSEASGLSAEGYDERDRDRDGKADAYACHPDKPDVLTPGCDPDPPTVASLGADLCDGQTEPFPLPLDGRIELAFNRPMDCRDPDSIRPCVDDALIPPTCPRDPETQAPLCAADHFEDHIGAAGEGQCVVRSTLEKVTVSQGADVLTDLQQGWGGRLGDPETRPHAKKRRYEVYTVRPARRADGSPAPDPYETPDACFDVPVYRSSCGFGPPDCAGGTIFAECELDPLPLECEGPDGQPRQVGRYVVDQATLELFDTTDEGTLVPAGQCSPSNECPELSLGGPCEVGLVCHDLAGRLVAPRVEDVSYAQLCQPQPDWIPIGWCPGQEYEVQLVTQRSVTGCEVHPDNALPEACTLRYRVEEPDSLEPYVLGTHPGRAPHYLGYDVVVQFANAAVCEVFDRCEGLPPLELQVRRIIDGEPEEAPLVSADGQVYGCRTGGDPELPATLGLRPGEPLAPETLYELRIPNKEGSYYRTTFTTSRFATFGEAMQGAQARASGDRVVLTTPEPLDWGRVSARLGSTLLNRSRISEDDATTHVFDLEGGVPAGSTLELVHHAQALQGLCSCDPQAQDAGDSQCAGIGGVCGADGVCESSRPCIDDSECSGVCVRKGPTARVLGVALDEQATITLDEEVSQ